MFKTVADEKGNCQTGKHIFISYNHSHQETVMQIAAKLKVRVAG